MTPVLDTGRSKLKQMVLPRLVRFLFESGPRHITLFTRHHHRHNHHHIHHKRLNLCTLRPVPLDRDEDSGFSIFVLVSPHHDLSSGDTFKTIFCRSCHVLPTFSLVVEDIFNYARHLQFLCLSCLVKPKSGVQHLVCATSQFVVYVLLTIQTS